MRRYVANPQRYASRRIDHTFNDVFDPRHQLLRVDPRRNTYLACALLARGNASISEVNTSIGRIKADLRMVPWNPDGFKIGLCNVPPAGTDHSVLCLANNTAITSMFEDLQHRFNKIYKDKKAFVHHYTEYMDEQEFQISLEALTSLTQEYAAFAGVRHTAEPVRTVPAV